ncbi:hypothetical protein [Streptomyces lydicus]|nr:hypothetical protein [Streptomyces lydicus]MCZ1011529.1 hypothetical protein [Streptomyces lydicus]
MAVSVCGVLAQGGDKHRCVGARWAESLTDLGGLLDHERAILNTA